MNNKKHILATLVGLALLAGCSQAPANRTNTPALRWPTWTPASSPVTTSSAT
jgi:uncharacterized lipoprotein YajG